MREGLTSELAPLLFYHGFRFNQSPALMHNPCPSVGSSLTLSPGSLLRQLIPV